MTRSKRKVKKIQLKWADIRLPYFKQGDDLHWFLKDNPPKKALLLDAEMLEFAAKQLRRISKIISNRSVSFQADTHHIGVSGPAKVIDNLIALKLAEKPAWEDEEECDCPEGEEDEPA
jgi:hypothetical protein